MTPEVPDPNATPVPVPSRAPLTETIPPEQRQQRQQSQHVHAYQSQAADQQIQIHPPILSQKNVFLQSPASLDPSADQVVPTSVSGYMDGKTPSAWVQWFLEKDQHITQDIHVHELIMFDPPIMSAMEEFTRKKDSIEEGDKENDPTAPQITDDNMLNLSSQTVQSQDFMCSSCLKWFQIFAHIKNPHLFQSSDPTLNQRFHSDCPCEPLHHIHHEPMAGSELNISSYVCCSCNYTLTVTVSSPVITHKLLTMLYEKRPDHITESHPRNQPTVHSSLNLLCRIASDAIGLKITKPINLSGETFTSKLGMDETSRDILERIGFTIDDDNRARPPDPLHCDSLKRAYHELTFHLSEYERRNNIPRTLPLVQQAGHRLRFLAGVSRQFFSSPTTTINPYPYTVLGATPDLPDNLLIFAFNKAAQENPERVFKAIQGIPESLSYIDALNFIRQDRPSYELEEKVTIENSKLENLSVSATPVERNSGTLTDREVYRYFGLDPEHEKNAEDEVVIGLYRAKLTEDPSDKEKHKTMLRAIAKVRESNRLQQFIETDGESEDTIMFDAESQESLLPNLFSTDTYQRPVGLRNIGNTCYLNSLLQFYFALKPLRETVLHIDDFVEDETKPDWKGKRVGERSVGKGEVARAKVFVSLLRDLFVTLQHTALTSTAPNEELAIMALTPAAAVEAQANEEVRLERERTILLEEAEEARLHATTATTTTIQDDELVHRETSHEPITTDHEVENKTTQPISPVSPTAATDEGEDTVTEVGDDIPSSGISHMEGIEANTDTPPSYEQVISATMSELNERVPVDSTQATGSYTGYMLDQDQWGPAPPLPQVDGWPTTTSTERKLPSVEFGRQQDVTECMNNVMHLLELALKPLPPDSVFTSAHSSAISDSSTIDPPSLPTSHLIKKLFYGRTLQTLSYTSVHPPYERITSTKLEEFGNLIVVAEEGRDLMDGLDLCFGESFVSYNEAQDGRAHRTLAVRDAPPVLCIQVQRVRFDRATMATYKSNAFMQFERSIYLDRYLEKNWELLKERRAIVRKYKKAMDQARNRIKEYSKDGGVGKWPLAIPELIDSTVEILQNEANIGYINQSDLTMMVELLQKEAARVRAIIKEDLGTLTTNREKIKMAYNEFTECEYRVAAVFVHQGEVNFGHYWIYIYDFDAEQWWQFNDANVFKVDESEVFKDTTGKSANPYCIVYVKAEQAKDLVNTVCRQPD